jgi:hypothetical protein
MKYLKKIFENKEDINFINEEKQTLNEILYEVSDLGYRVEVSYAVCLTEEFDWESSYKLNETDLGNKYYKCGYIIDIGERNDSIISSALNMNQLGQYLELIKSITDSLKNINSHLDTDSHFVMSDNGDYTLYIFKNNPSADDYYYLLRNDLNEYIDQAENFSGFELYKTGSDYYLEFQLLEEEPVAIKQIKQLKEFCSDAFETIKYESFEKINNRSFKIKNPKIESIKI